MNWSIQKTQKRMISVLLAFALMVPMIPAPVYAAAPTPQETYNSYVAEMTAAATSISAIAASYGEVDFGNGYKINLQTELTAFANSIQSDLSVAAAIVSGDCNDPRLKASGINNSSSTGYNQSNFNTAFPDKYAAAVKYLEQGGIAVQKYGGTFGTSLQYFFSYKSKLNPGYTASASILGMSESGKTNVVTLSRNYPETVGAAALSLTAMLDMMKNYKAAADSDALKAYFLTLPCADKECEKYGNTGCTDWTHRLLVPEDTFLTAASKFRSDIDRDMTIAGDLATGKIDSNLWFANKNGKAYYNNTAAAKMIDRLNAAIAFLNNGGYTCGSATVGIWSNQLSYRSNFNTSYQVAATIIGTGYTESNQSAILPLVDGTLSILRCGINADNLGMVYDLKVNEVNGYIAQAEALRGTLVPQGGMYDQSQYDAAIDDFITKAESDLNITDFLLSGELDEELASTWTENLGFLVSKSLKDTYKDMTQPERQANAIRFFGEGGYAYGYSINGYGYQLEYKSGFYPGYSSGLFGVGASKANAVTIMHDTLEALKLGNKYMTATELAKYKYDQSLARLETIKKDPSSIVDQLLSDDTQLKSLIGDLNTIVGSLDDIVSIMDTAQKLGIGKDALDPILKQVGLSYDMLVQLADLRDTLQNLGIDTSGNVPIEDSLKPIAGTLVGSVIDLAILSAQASAGFGTESGYNTATALLDNSYNTLMTSADSAINSLLAPVASAVAPIRPYLGMLGSGIDVIQNVFTIVDQVNSLQNNFTAGGLSETTYTMANISDSLADFLEDFQDSAADDLLLGLLANSNIGGTIANGTADLLNRTLNQITGLNIGISGSDLGFISDAANSLANQGLKNPTALVPLLRSSSDALRRAAQLEGGIQSAIDGDYEGALNALTSDFGGMVRNLGDIWNEIVALYDNSDTQESATLMLDQKTGMVSLNAPEGDIFLESVAQGLNAETTDTFRVLCDPSASYGTKAAKLKEFKNFLKDIGEFASTLDDTAKSLKSACDWARDNLPKEEAKAFAEGLARHYAEQLQTCIERGLSCSTVQEIIAEIKDTTSEIKDVVCFIKGTGELVINAEPGKDEGVLYTFTTNYDTLQERLDSLLRSLGISVGYTVNSPKELFEMNGNALIASGETEEGNYQVKVAYKMFIQSCSHSDVVITLGTKTVDVEIGGGPVNPEPVEQTVTYYPNNGTEDLYTAKAEVGTPVTVLGNDITGFTKEGYHFNGWNTEANGTGDVYTVDSNFNMPKDGLDLFAQWARNPQPLTLVYYPNNGTQDPVYEVKADTENAITMILGNDVTGFTNHGYKFAGWNTEANGEGDAPAIGSEFTVSEDGAALYAQWEKDQTQWHTVTFTVGDNGSLNGKTAFSDILDGTAWVSVIAVPTASPNSGYSFSGWSPALPDNMDTIKITSDLAYKAIFEKINNGGGGGGGGGSSRIVIPEQEVPLGGIFSLMSLPAKPKDGIVYYLDGSGKTVYVPFSFAIGDQIYFFGQVGIQYNIKPNPKQFEDIAGHWAYDNILAIASREAFQGYPDGSFQPGQSMTRAMLASVFARMATADTSTYNAKVFDDVSPAAWYGPSVAWALDKGIVTGVGGNNFSPDANVTRQDMALMLTRFIEYMDIQLKEVQDAPFADQNGAGSWAKEAIIQVQKYNIVGGKPNNMFDPYANSTRAEIATMLYRLIEASITFAHENAASTVIKTN